MSWIFSPSPSGECCECRSSVCAECECAWGGAADGGIQSDLPFSANYNVAADFITSHDISIEVCAAASTQFIVKADGSTLYDSGCVSSVGCPTASTTVTVPAGTDIISIDVTQCSGTLNEWEFLMACA